MKTLATVLASGVRSPLGLDSRATAMLLRTGLAAIGAAPIDLGDGEPVTMAHDVTLDPYVVGDERAILLARAALAELARAFAPGAVRSLRTRVVLALPEPNPGAVRAATSPLRSRDLGLAIREVFGDCMIDVDPRGSAGLAYALPSALAVLARREVDAVLVGGVHTDYDHEALAALDAVGRLFRPESVDAVIPGECAAFVLLGRPDLAGRLGLRPLASIVGIGSATGDVTPDSTGAFDASALAAAFRMAAVDLPAELRIGWALGDHGLEHFRNRELYAAVTRANGLFTAPFSIDSPAQRLGRTGAASLPLFVALSGEAFRHQFAPSPIGLLFAGSDRGERGAIVVSAP